MLISIIQNIVSNAIKHTDKGREITVSAKTKDDKIIVQVKDTGIGMSKEIIESFYTTNENAFGNQKKG
jgi:signal transduction histidine kinase